MRVAEDIADNDNNGNSTFAVSESSVLTYRAKVAPASRQLTGMTAGATGSRWSGRLAVCHDRSFSR